MIRTVYKLHFDLRISMQSPPTVAQLALKFLIQCEINFTRREMIKASPLPSDIKINHCTSK